MSRQYITNGDLYALWEEWNERRQTGAEAGVSAQLGQAVMRIARGVAGKPSYSGYDDDMKEDMISEAYLKVVRNLKNMKPERKNSFFNYITLCCECAFKTFLKKHYKYLKLKQTMMEKILKEK